MDQHPLRTTKPYLVRAIREWALDNELTPQVLVDVSVAGVEVPQAYVKDGQIVLNIAEQAVRLEEFGNEWLRFSARFDGRPFSVSVPIEAIVAVYARENGQGIFFKDPDGPPPGPEGDKAKSADPVPEDKTARSHLKLVK